jgi:hypothetical protein
MSGFEVVVRPVVFPNIRPTAPRVIPPADEPDKGVTTLGGSGGGGPVDLPYSWSASTSRSPVNDERERTYDVDRVYQKDDDGKPNKSNFVDVERLTKLGLMSTDKGLFKYNFATPPQVDNVETLQTNLTRTADQ